MLGEGYHVTSYLGPGFVTMLITRLWKTQLFVKTEKNDHVLPKHHAFFSFQRSFKQKFFGDGYKGMAAGSERLAEGQTRWAEPESLGGVRFFVDFMVAVIWLLMYSSQQYREASAFLSL